MVSFLVDIIHIIVSGDAHFILANLVKVNLWVAVCIMFISFFILIYFQSFFSLDMNSILLQDSDSGFEVFELFDPAATGKVVGRISLSCSVEVRSTQLILPLSSWDLWMCWSSLTLPEIIDRIQLKQRKILQDAS